MMQSEDVRATRVPCCRGRLMALVVCILIASNGSCLAADEPSRAIFLTVPNPLTSQAVEHIKQETEKAITRDRASTIIFDFNPQGRPSVTRDFYPCYELARYLDERLGNANVMAYAYVQASVTGHTVLPVLACHKILMSENARLGDIYGEHDRRREAQEQEYKNIAKGRRSPDIVLRMLGPRHGGKPDDKGTAYTFEEAEKVGLCERGAYENRKQVAIRLGIPMETERADPMLYGTPSACLLEVRGVINGALVESEERRIRRALRQGKNYIILQLECGGGEAQVARRFAEVLGGLRDEQNNLPVRTIAYLPLKVEETTMLIALGCTDICIKKNIDHGNLPDRARQAGVVQHVVDDLAGLYALYGLDAGQVQVISSDWLDSLVEFLCSPWTSIGLIMIGITGLILEFKLPGVTLPGIIAAVCFVLFFWSQSRLAGQLAWLAALLFVLGLLLLALEVFVIPGFGAAGICGILLVVGSVVLVIANTSTKSSGSGWGLEGTLAALGVGMLLAVVGSLVLASYIPQIPIINRLVLKPQTDDDELLGEGRLSPEMPSNQHLLGVVGVAATPLRPAGKVRIGNDFVDVVAEGSYISEGTRVQVIEIEGNRVVVKEI